MNVDVTEHLGLVRWAIKRHSFGAPRTRGQLGLDDLEQVGAMALMRAACTYDESRGTFATYAAQWLRAFIGREVMNHSATVRVPVHQQELRWRAGQRMCASERSIDAPIGHDDDGRDRTLHDVIEAPAPDSSDEREHAAATLELLLEKADLTDRQRYVLERRRAGKTLQAIGCDLGLTREAIRQVELRALAELRAVASILELTA